MESQQLQLRVATNVRWLVVLCCVKSLLFVNRNRYLDVLQKFDGRATQRVIVPSKHILADVERPVTASNSGHPFNQNSVKKELRSCIRQVIQQRLSNGAQRYIALCAPNSTPRPSRCGNNEMTFPIPIAMRRSDLFCSQECNRENII